MTNSLSRVRDVAALAGAEMRARLAAGVAGLRRGLAAARALHGGLRAEAAELQGFIPSVVEGARAGMQRALAQQARMFHTAC